MAFRFRFKLMSSIAPLKSIQVDQPFSGATSETITATLQPPVPSIANAMDGMGVVLSGVLAGLLLISRTVSYAALICASNRTFGAAFPMLVSSMLWAAILSHALYLLRTPSG